MQRLSDSQKAFLKDATTRYHRSLADSPADGYLRSRGLWPTNESVRKFRLGYVADPLSGHEMYRGMLAIPYLRWHPDHGWMTVSIRFRRLVGGGAKYLSVAGDQPWLYNTYALVRHSPVVAITEGEIDAITASLCGIPAVGVPGAQMWKPHFREMFAGYRDVYILADGDDPGLAFANAVAGTMFNSKVIPMPPGEDVNSLVIGEGKQALLERMK